MNTPTKTTGIGAGKAADLTYWEGAARLIASCATSSKIVVEKSTVPVKTAEAISKVHAAALCWLEWTVSPPPAGSMQPMHKSHGHAARRCRQPSMWRVITKPCH